MAHFLSSLLKYEWTTLSEIDLSRIDYPSKKWVLLLTSLCIFFPHILSYLGVKCLSTLETPDLAHRASNN